MGLEISTGFVVTVELSVVFVVGMELFHAGVGPFVCYLFDPSVYFLDPLICCSVGSFVHFVGVANSIQSVLCLCVPLVCYYHFRPSVCYLGCSLGASIFQIGPFHLTFDLSLCSSSPKKDPTQSDAALITLPRGVSV